MSVSECVLGGSCASRRRDRRAPPMEISRATEGVSVFSPYALLRGGRWFVRASMRGARGSACLFLLPFVPFSLEPLSSRRRRSSCSICRRSSGGLPPARESLRFVPPPGGAGRGGVRAARPSRAAMGGGDLFALDFDGVFCDSCGESSLSAVKAAKVRWPLVFEQVDAAMEEWIVEQMHTVYSHIGLDCCYDSVDSDILYHTAKQQSHRCSESSVSRPLAERQAGAAVAEHGGFTLRISCLSHYLWIAGRMIP